MSIDWTKPIETESGKSAKVISDDYKTDDHTLVVVQYETPNYGSLISLYEQSGKPWANSPLLRNCKTKREGWVSIYPNDTSLELHHTEEAAILHAGKNAIATVKIEWEE